MSETHCIWSNPRPIISIERGGGGQLGNCYYGSSFVITTTRPLDMEDIKKIRETGLIGYGQEFYVRGQVLGDSIAEVPKTISWDTTRSVPPTGMDTVEATVVDRRTGKVIPDAKPINEYTKELLEPMEMPFYVYLTEDRVDSSD